MPVLLAFILAYVRFLGRNLLLAKPVCFSWRSKCFVSSSLVSWGLALHDILGWRQSKRTQWLGLSKDQLQERWPDTASTWSAYSPHAGRCAAPTVLLPFKDEIWLLNKTRKEQNKQERCPHREGVQRGAWASAAQAGWGAQNMCQIPCYLAVDPSQLLRLRSQLSLLSLCTVGFAWRRCTPAKVKGRVSPVIQRSQVPETQCWHIQPGCYVSPDRGLSAEVAECIQHGCPCSERSIYLMTHS